MTVTTIRLIYDPIDGIAVPDGAIDNWCHNLITGTMNGDISVGSETLVTALRMLHAEGEIFITEVVFQNQSIQIDADGSLSAYPHGLCDYTLHFLSKMAKAKKERLNR